MLSIVRVHLPSDIPIAGCEISPYVLLRRPDNVLSTEDVPESNPCDGFFLRCRWYRVQSDKKVAMCSVHPSEPATLQCLGCVKARVPVAKSYHCSTQCYSASWRYHVSLHTRSYAVSSRDTLDDELFGKYGSGQGSNSGSAANSNSNVANGTNSSTSNGWSHGNSNRERSDNQQPQQQANGEIWYEVGRGKNYTPTAEDVGYVLKLECVAVDANTAQTVGPVSTVLTSRVIPAPSPSPRRMIQLPVHTNDGMLNIPSMMLSHGDNLGRGPIRGERGTFTVLSYNVLADLYATSEMYSYCPPWALSWSYRRQNLLRELVEYGADIMCLQEVQSDHYDEFFAPELEKHGYASVYKKKTAEMYTGTSYAIDGCATFFRRDKFSLVKKYEVEFNKAALSLAEALNSNSKKAALNRLLKDNVALIVVLESRDSVEGSDNLSAGKRQLLCVANTHIHANPELKDVKLWQVHTLLKGLEKIAASADIPMLVTGDFNSVPGSAPHSLLATGRVDPSHPELATDPLGILRPASKLCHQLPLMSAYASQGQLNHRLDATSSEPIFTNCTREFFGTLDYIFFTVDSLQVESLLELLDEETLRKDTALPSPEWSSDHIALLAEFRYKPRNRR